ncbi:MAG: c-type cytochrome [Candidatus Aminicenantia bacterium]
MNFPRKNLAILILLWVVILIAVFLAKDNADNEFYPLPQDPLKGRKLFVDKGCVKCHSIWGSGEKLGPDLVRISKNQSLLQLAGLLWTHSPKMVKIMEERGLSRPTFTPEEMGALLAYIYYLNFFDKPGDFLEGEKQFSKKGCNNCHSIGGKGKEVGPPLDSFGRFISPIFMANALWNHGIQMVSMMKKRGINWPQFEGPEMIDLIAYIRSFSLDESEERLYTLPGNPKRGEKIFTQKGCVICHAVRGKGSTFAPDLGDKKLHRSATEIIGTMWGHSFQMLEEMKRKGLSVPYFSTQEMSDLISYLYFIRFSDERGNPKNGKKLFSEKGCIICHSGEKKAGTAPDLSKSELAFNSIELVSAMWNHAPVMEKMLKEKGLVWPRFEKNEMIDLVGYIRSIAFPKQDFQVEK